MKRTISIAYAAFALLSFTSCQKENLVSGNQEPSQRIVTAVFENDDTKTTLGTNDIPLWAEGNKICILASNGREVIELEESNITGNGRKVTFTLTKGLSGTLYAVYPASATTMTSCSGSIDFTIPELQDGTFGSANICVAKSTATDATNKDNLIFSNVTSVLEFSQTASSTGVLRVAVTAANAIAGKCSATFGTDNKATISTNELTGKLIWTSAPTTAQDKYYVAIAPVETGTVNFKYYTNLQEKNEAKSSKPLVQNKIYELTIPTTGYADSYVTIGGKKWATTNIGATNPQDYGDLYSWGETVIKADYSESKYSSTAKNISTDISPSSGNDVARVKWGSSWRMPTKQDFTALANACKYGGYTEGYFSPIEKTSLADVKNMGVYWVTNYNSGDGKKGLVFCDGTNKLFFPAAGFSNSGSRGSSGSSGDYWSSTRYSPTNAYGFSFSIYNVHPQGNVTRYYGRSVRPVSD